MEADGRLLTINLTPAGVQEAQGAEQIVKAVRERWPWLRHPFADGAYDGGRLMIRAAYRGFVIETVRKLSGHKGFQPLPRRRAVERTIAGYLGLASGPWNSGSVSRDQGIQRSGNPRARRTAVDLAWLRHQPESGLSR